MDISLKEFENQVMSMKPRFFDTYILPAFLIGYAIKSKTMRKNARRILFSSGVYMGMRSYAEYKTAYNNAIKYLKKLKNEQR